MRAETAPDWAAIARPAACAADRAAVFLLPLLAVVRPATAPRYPGSMIDSGTDAPPAVYV